MKLCIAQQAVDTLDAVLVACVHSDRATYGRGHNAPTAQQSHCGGDYGVTPLFVHAGTACGDELTYVLVDAHGDASKGFGEPLENNVGASLLIPRNHWTTSGDPPGAVPEFS
jgi:hypothetical protein